MVLLDEAVRLAQGDRHELQTHSASKVETVTSTRGSPCFSA